MEDIDIQITDTSSHEYSTRARKMISSIIVDDPEEILRKQKSKKNNN